jgi:hypothetical protein
MSDHEPVERISFDTVQAVIDRIGAEWLEEENIVDISPCIKVTKGVADPRLLAIGFHVAHKMAIDELKRRKLRPIPADIEGIPTDVIATHQPALGGVDERATRSAMFDTLVGGIAVGNADINAYGTLGMVLLAASDQRLVGLTNEHVLVFDIDGQVGDRVEQPRFYLQSEVSLESAACCPDGQLRYRGVDNPIVLAAGAVFAAAAIAAVASDQIDPHRRGQDATPVEPGERTQRETVRFKVDYPDVPLPGTPFRTAVSWRYERHTDRRVLDHEVTEEPSYQHFTRLQRLVTERPAYERGDVVRLIAALGPDNYNGRCNYLVTAAILSPSHGQAHKIVMRPWQPRDVARGTPAADLLSRLGDNVSTDEEAKADHEREQRAASTEKRCLFVGDVRLPPECELGTWSTFLFAQTLNDVPVGSKAVEAARTIGGLPVTHNFVDAGRSTNILYGPSCDIALRPDGEFEVVERMSPEID